MAFLTTSNLSVNSIKTMLGVASLKAIFYKGTGLTTLKTLAELGVTVNKLWLGSSCPGANADAKLQNLLNDRKLSYFKGFGYNENLQLSPSYGMTFTSVGMSALPDTIDFPVTTSQTGYFTSQPSGSFSVGVGGTYLAGRYIALFVDSSEVVRVPIGAGLGSYVITLPSTVTYPGTIRISIVS